MKSAEQVLQTISDMYVFGVEPEMILTPYDYFDGHNVFQGPLKQIRIREVPGNFEPIVVPTDKTAFLWKVALRKIEEAALRREAKQT